IDDKAKREIRIAFDRLVNKLLHPPLESLREPSAGTLLEAVKKLFRLNDPNE
ncbi:MAG: glutamyl-tRNA reductase, partial [Planctomycetota bacterium]